MSGARGEGAIIDRKSRTVRLRHEPPGFVYELRGDHVAVEVVRVDQVTRSVEPYGRLQMVRGRWRAVASDSKHKTDALQLVARAWNCAPLLRTRAEDEGAGNAAAPHDVNREPGSGGRGPTSVRPRPRTM